MVSRALIPYYNNSWGPGMEGFLRQINEGVTSGLFIPVFLLVFYAAAIYLMSRTDYKLGGSIAFVSVLFFILGMIAQTFTRFNQLVIFIFAIGILVGIIMSFIENARS